VRLATVPLSTLESIAYNERPASPIDHQKALMWITAYATHLLHRVSEVHGTCEIFRQGGAAMTRTCLECGSECRAVVRTRQGRASLYTWEHGCMPDVRLCGIPGFRGAFGSVATKRFGSIASLVQTAKHHKPRRQTREPRVLLTVGRPHVVNEGVLWELAL